MEIRITSGARKHGFGKRRILAALINQSLSVTVPSASVDPKILFRGYDDFGIELEIISLVLPGKLLVIHAMPTAYRRKRT